MPIYEYACRKCRAHTEVLQKITDKPLTKCRKCGGRLEKQWSPTSFQFKGTGWYVTDYAGKKSEAGEEKKGDAAATTASASESANGDKAAPKETTAKKSGAAKTAPSKGTATNGD